MASDIRRDEFEGRNRQLPADLDQSAAFSTAAKSRNNLEQTPLGSPPSCYDVRSIFDSRPINAYDFNIAGSFTADEGELNYDVTFQVREGYVCVLRRLNHWFDPVPIGTIESRNDCLLTIAVNGGSVMDNVSVPVGVSSDSIWQGFVIADENDVVRARLTVSSLLPGQPTAWVHFYGNYILKTARPAVFEIANPVLSGDCAPASIKRAPAPAAPVSAPLVQTVPKLMLPELKISNIVSAGGRGGARVVAFDPARATLPGGVRPLTRQELQTFGREIEAFIAANKRFAPSLAPFVA